MALRGDVLLALQLYWFVLIIKVLVNLVLSGEVRRCSLTQGFHI